MRISLITNAIMYFIMGAFFFFIALSVPGGQFSVMSIVLVVIAALDLGLGIRFLRAHFRNKHNKNKNNDNDNTDDQDNND